MEYNSSYKSAVLGSLRSAASGLNSCKSVNINIPGDFEGAGILKSALNTLKGVNISGIISEVNSAAAGFEAAERAVEGGMLDFSSLFGSFIGSNISSKAHNYNLKNAQKSGTMYELDHLTEEQKEKINQGVKEASKDNWVFRTRASIVNGLVSIFKGGYKMGENIGDFIALRAEKLQEEHLRTIYKSNAEYEKANKEKYEKNIEKMRKETMSYVAKDYTEATFNRLYRNNNVLKEIDERAYNAFKTTGGAYKIGEQVAPAIVATGAMVVAPEAAPTIIPIVIGMNSGGRASEEYLQDKKMNSKEGIEQAYKDGEIDKKTYESYKYIWGLTSEEVIDVYLHGEKYGLTPLEVNKFMEIYHISQDMSDEYTTKENMENAIKYGNAVGAWDAAQYAIGMNLFKVNPTRSVLGNSSIRVGIDTSLNAADTPFKAVVRSSIDRDTDFETEFNKLGGRKSVGISAALGFAGSVFGEVMQYKAAENTANQIYEMQGIDPNNLYDEIKTSLKSDIMSGKISVDDANADDFLLNYAKSKGYSNKNIESWVKNHYDRIGKYGVDQGVYKNHIWYETASGKKLKNKRQFNKAFNNNEEIFVRHDDYFIQQADRLANRYKLDYSDAVEILEIMDTSGGMCSFSASSEALAYQYKDIPEIFKQKYGVELYRETGGISEELYVDYFMNSNPYLYTYQDSNGQIVTKTKGQIGNINERYISKNYYGKSKLSDEYRTYATLYDENLQKTPSYRTLSTYLNNKGVSDNIEVRRLYFSRPEGLSNGTIEDVIDAINNGESVNLSVRPYYNKTTKELESIKLNNTKIFKKKNSINGNHAMNVVGIKGDEVIISTWGEIWRANLSELQEKAGIFFASVDLK